MRHDVSRNTPRSGGIVSSLAEQVLEHGGAGADRVRALADVRELLRVAEQDDVVARACATAIASASDTWPASSTNSTSTGCRRSSRAHYHAVARRAA